METQHLCCIHQNTMLPHSISIQVNNVIIREVINSPSTVDTIDYWGTTQHALLRPQLMR